MADYIAFKGWQQHYGQQDSQLQPQIQYQPQLASQPLSNPQNRGFYGGSLNGMPSLYAMLQSDAREDRENGNPDSGTPLGAYKNLFDRPSPVPGNNGRKSIVEELFFSDGN